MPDQKAKRDAFGPRAVVWPWLSIMLLLWIWKTSFISVILLWLNNWCSKVIYRFEKTRLLQWHTCKWGLNPPALWKKKKKKLSTTCLSCGVWNQPLNVENSNVTRVQHDLTLGCGCSTVWKWVWDRVVCCLWAPLWWFQCYINSLVNFFFFKGQRLRTEFEFLDF